MRATTRRRQGRGRLLLLALACLIGSGACAKPQPVAAPPPPPPPSTIIVLLPDADGSVGQVTITNASGSQILSQGREASAIQGAGAAPSGPFVITDDEVKEKFGKTLATLPPEPVRFILYF